jgi:hypothetical protein
MRGQRLILRREGLRAKHPEDAVRVLEPALPYELGDLGNPLHPLYLRGEAFLAMKDRDRVIEASKLATICPYYAKTPCALARLHFARAHILSGNVVRAKTLYTEFLAPWSNADPTTPLLQQAKAEFARLQ